MVIKKKKRAPAVVPKASSATKKHKAEDREAQASQDKKARLEESPVPCPPP
jgi:ribosomal protein L12E/L44/L45/RPP1/RPP2